MITILVTLISLEIAIYFGDWIKTVLPINMLFLLLLVQLVYVGIRWYVKGVYVDNGYSVKFKTVDIIYEGDTYYLSRLNYTGEEQLNIFDKLIASKTELYDGMPLSDL